LRDRLLPAGHRDRHRHVRELLVLHATARVWLICRDDGSFIFNVTGTTVIGVTAEAPAESCSPFLWSSTGVVNGLSCDGAFEVTVDEGP
jgi:hypothetical protein